ncbi:hypothetical protein LPJ60_001362 [Coemansia sp. RSA 2675]|nr:hypothetical protein LPJ60_001362 [Coemansia sp. RSA 2675]
METPAIAKRFREMLQNTCRREFSDSGACVDMVPIDYHADMHSLHTTNERMDRATLPSIPWIRTLDNEVIGDILYYFSTYHGNKMLSLVINKLNAAYTDFIAEHPDFTGPVSIIAHSLGGLVCYEILYYMRLMGEARARGIDFGELVNPRERERYRGLPKLLFTPNRLFTMGSPLGGTLVFRNLSFSDYLIPASVGYHNIFHPYDPFGYRTEPLVDDYYEDTPAVPITTELVCGSCANSVSLFGNKRMTLGGSMADLGKTFVDAVTTAPANFSSTVIRAAKTSVSMPINAIMNTGRRSSLHNEPLHRRKASLFGSSTTVFSSKLSVSESGTSKRRHSLSKILPSLKSFALKSHRSSKSSSSVSADNLPIGSSRRQSIIAEEPPTTTDGGSSTPESSLSFSCTSQMAVTINAMVAVSPGTSQESSTSEVSAHATPANPPHHSAAPSSATATSSSLPSADEDDVILSHIMRLFKVSRTPTREQQIAEAQGLPLSSRLVSGHRVGARASTTAPNELAPAHRPIHSAHAHSRAADAESGPVVRQSSPDTDAEVPPLRRYSTMPPELPLIEFAPFMPANDAIDAEERPAATAASEAEEETEEEEPPSTNTKLAHRLPYTERMDYIIPFTKT